MKWVNQYNIQSIYKLSATLRNGVKNEKNNYTIIGDINDCFSNKCEGGKSR